MQNAPSKAPGGVSMGTTILGFAFDTGIVLAADSRTSAGSYVANRVSKKITKLTDTIYVCRSGSAADTQNLADVIKMYLTHHALETGSPASVRTAANLLHKVAYNNRERLSAGLIIGGVDADGTASLYSVPLGGNLIKAPFAIGGSGSTFISGLINESFREGMSKDEAVSLALKCVAHAMRLDGSSGGIVRMEVITQDGVETHTFLPHQLPVEL